MVDMAHIAGLVAVARIRAGALRGRGDHHYPQDPARASRWLILTNNEDLAKKINKAVFPGTQGGPAGACDRRQGSLLRRGAAPGI